MKIKSPEIQEDIFSEFRIRRILRESEKEMLENGIIRKSPKVSNFNHLEEDILFRNSMLKTIDRIECLIELLFIA